MARSLPVLNEGSSALRPDGGRAFIVPADVSGRLTTLRRIFFAVLLLVYVLTPWIQVGGHPAVFLDIEHRAFYLFGATFNAQDVWLVFFLVSGMGFLLLLVTALWGRVWCGYACPQTVFLEGVYRSIERAIEGPRNIRLKRERAGASFALIWRKGLKHLVFIVLSVMVAHVLLSYFVSLPGLFVMVRDRPAEHPEAFAWAFGMSGLMYFNFAWFREQFCIVICPYGRLQSVLTDQDSLVIGYDKRRGEPRGKAKDTERGACVDCGRCVAVCPTGIDIRNGLQLECIGCTACVDACDEIMVRTKQPKGLIRYDSLNGFAGVARRFLRPRVFVYAALGVVGLLVATLSVRARTPFEANLLRLQGAPFVLENGDAQVRNALELHLVNKHAGPVTFTLSGEPAGQLSYVFAQPRVTLGSLRALRVPVFVTAPNDGGRRVLKIQVSDGSSSRVVEVPFVAPR